MTKNNQLERTYLEGVLNIRTGPYFVCSLTLAAIDGPCFRMVLIFGWSLFSVIYGIKPALQNPPFFLILPFQAEFCSLFLNHSFCFELSPTPTSNRVYIAPHIGR